MDMKIPNPVRSAFAPTADDDGRVIVNIGPSHPATHGTVQIITELDGEKVLRADVHCGYLHRGFEKECEAHTWHNLIPYTDRLNYCSGLINNFAYCEAVEKLMAIEITPRCKYLRTLLTEYSRIADQICEQGRFGQKTGAGWYRYETGKRDAIPDPGVEATIVADSSSGSRLSTRVATLLYMLASCDTAGRNCRIVPAYAATGAR